ncbi:MAG: hypothetical protein NTV25_03655 [Methanothrix sp.]|nr:hypothetical protein [Methanothrix sp.]
MDEVERKPCENAQCEHYYSDGEPCIKIKCMGWPGITVEEMGPKIAGGRTIRPER